MASRRGIPCLSTYQFHRTTCTSELASIGEGLLDDLAIVIVSSLCLSSGPFRYREFCSQVSKVMVDGVHACPRKGTTKMNQSYPQFPRTRSPGFPSQFRIHARQKQYNDLRTGQQHEQSHLLRHPQPLPACPSPHIAYTKFYHGIRIATCVLQ